MPAILPEYEVIFPDPSAVTVNAPVAVRLPSIKMFAFEPLLVASVMFGADTGPSAIIRPLDVIETLPADVIATERLISACPPPVVVIFRPPPVIFNVPVPVPGEVRKSTELPDAGLTDRVPLPPRFTVDVAPAGRATVIVVVPPGATSDTLLVPEIAEPEDSTNAGVLRTKEPPPRARL